MASNKKRYVANLDSIKQWYGSLYFKNDKESLAWLDDKIETAKKRCETSDPNREICAVLGAIMERRKELKERESGN